jgi:hypothetical protein
MRPRTPKRAAQERLYRVQAKVFLADHEHCVRCSQPATEVHHQAGREGWRLLYQPWWVPLCSGCHRLVTLNPTWALQVGLSRKRHSKEPTA